MANNLLQKVEAYAADEAFPQLLLELDILDLVNTKYNDWKSAEKVGTRGDSVALQLPSRYVSRNSLAITPPPADTGQNYNERRTALSITEVETVDFVIPDKDLATYDFESGGSLNVNVDAVIAEIATNVNQFVTNKLALAGYRFSGVGNPADPLPDTLNLDYTQTVANVRNFYNFGGNSAACFVLPSVAVTKISGTGLQQFVPNRNDEMSRDWSLGTLQGMTKKVDFYSSDLLPIHTAGTVADNQTPADKYIITVVDNDPTITHTLPGTNTAVPASRLTITGLPNGQTVITDDMFDIVNNGGVNDLKFLQFVGHHPALSNAQALVVSGGTVAGGSITIDVIPRLQRTSPAAPAKVTDPDDNLTRAIDVTASQQDQVRFLKSHTAGFVLLKGYAHFAAPRLGDTDPYPNAVVNSETGGVSMRMYHGYLPQTGAKAMVHSMIYGALGVPEGIMRIPFKTSSLLT